MKKLMITACMAIAFLSFTEMEAQENKLMQSSKAQSKSLAQKTYKQISPNDLPKLIQERVANNYEEAKIEEAYQDNQKNYKIVLKLEDVNTSNTIYLNQKGEMLRK